MLKKYHISMHQETFYAQDDFLTIINVENRCFAQYFYGNWF